MIPGDVIGDVFSPRRHAPDRIDGREWQRRITEWSL